MIKISISSLVVMLLSVTVVFSQPYSTKNEKAIKNYEEAKKLFMDKEFEKAISHLQQAIKKDTIFVEAYYLLAGCYHYSGNKEQNIATLQQCSQRNGNLFPIAYYYLASEQLHYGQYQEASESFNKLLQRKQLMPKPQAEAFEKEAANCKEALQMYLNPVPFQPTNLGPNVNSPDDDYLPALTADESTMIVTSRLTVEGKTVAGMAKWEQEDFFISRKQNDTWQPRQNLGAPINTNGNEGAQTITADGRMFFFTGCDREDGRGSCDIYCSIKRGNRWMMPQNIGRTINTRYWESQPTVSADGRTLYFVSNRPGGYGNMDIWVSMADSAWNWSRPKNVGPAINTPQEDQTPFIHADGRTLYFSSNGHGGMGGVDLFKVTRIDDSATQWTKPINLGYPINTWEDETSLIVGAQGKKAYISSKRDGGVGGADLYEFDLYQAAQPTIVTYLKGTVFDAKTKQKLAARYELIDLASGKLVVTSVSDPETGEFLVPLPVNKNYALSISKTKYLFHSENFTLTKMDSTNKAFAMDIGLQPIEVGQSVVLNNIFFATDSFALKPESKVELQKLLSFLQLNKETKIEIGGHTDNSGQKEKNRILSDNRAKSVYQYLIEKGIEATRLKYKGFGDSMPLVPNDSDAHKALNRRTEFKVIE